MMKRYDESVAGVQNISDKYAKRAIFLTTMQNITTFPLIFEGIMIYAAYRTIVSQTMGLAELAIMFSAMVASSWILIGLLGNITESLKNGKFLQYFRTFMEYEERIPEDQDGIMPEETIHSIEFRDVCFEYAQGNPIINNLSFCVNGNQIVALVGHNGAGKTTVIKLLFRLYDPTSGEIFVNGINIKKYNLKAYRRLFSAAFQDYRVMAMTVKDNILMGAEIHEEIVEKSLKNAGIWDKVQSLPNGVETILTKEFDSEGAVLSGGEVQKIIIARAFAQKALVKVFDEPSSALDPIAEYELYKGIMRESAGHNITLFVSHRLSSVKDADLVFMLENGAVIESGTHAQLMSQKLAYYEMFTKQAQNYLAVESYEEGVAV
jgi:ATP-binding cassette subfamily B protein